MIRAIFEQNGVMLTGVTITGHADSKDSTSDEQMQVLCAAISSVAQYIANTLTECMNASAEVSATPSETNCFNQLVIRLQQPDVQQAMLFRGLLVHLRALAEDYPGAISVSFAFD